MEAESIVTGSGYPITEELESLAFRCPYCQYR